MEYIVSRLVSSLLCGVLLSQSGSLLQLATKNVLSSPSTLGFDGLSVLLVLITHSLTLWLGIESGWPLWLGMPVSICVGLLMNTFFDGRERYERVILLGLTFNLAVGAIFSLWQFLFLAFNLPFPVELWFGHFRFADQFTAAKFLTAELLLLGALRYFWKDLGLFTLGKSVSRNLRVNTTALFTFIFVTISASTYLVVSTFGAFSFLGLVFPLVARKFWFERFDLKGELVLGSVCNGLAFMLFDYLCYQFPFYGAEIPVGLIATGVGAVSLIIILWKSSDREFLAKPKK